MSEQSKGQSRGRENNAATSDFPDVSKVKPQDYPAARDGEEKAAVEGRSFDNPAPRQGAGDGSVPASTSEGRTGPQGDPAEGKR